MEWLFYTLLLQFGILTSNAKLYSEDDVYTTNSPTTYSKIPSGCSLFGSKFETDNFKHKIILNIKETRTYWIGAKIGFKRNINPLGGQNECNNNRSGSLDECNSHCKDWNYFSYTEYSCSCSNDNKTGDVLLKAGVCENPENGLCILSKCVVYERNVSDKEYVCGVYQFEKSFGIWIFTTEKCSTKLSFICDGDGNSSDFENIKSSWLEADHVCSYGGHNLVQTENIDDKFKDGKQYWVSFFRRKKISWGIDLTKTVCVAARLQSNGSYQLETHFCNESLEALCHRTEHTNNGASEAEIMTASLGTILGGVLVCITVVAVIKNRRGHLPNIQTPPQEDLNISSTSTGRKMIKDIDGPLYSNSDDPVGDLSIYSLAMAYSEPGNNKDTPDNQYDSVTYKEPRKTDEDKHYDHIMENHYENPYS